MIGPSIDPVAMAAIDAKIDRILAEITAINARLDDHEARIVAVKVARDGALSSAAPPPPPTSIEAPSATITAPLPNISMPKSLATTSPSAAATLQQATDDIPMNGRASAKVSVAVDSGPARLLGAMSAGVDLAGVQLGDVAVSTIQIGVPSGPCSESSPAGPRLLLGLPRVPIGNKRLQCCPPTVLLTASAHQEPMAGLFCYALLLFRLLRCCCFSWVEAIVCSLASGLVQTNILLETWDPGGMNTADLVTSTSASTIMSAIKQGCGCLLCSPALLSSMDSIQADYSWTAWSSAPSIATTRGRAVLEGWSNAMVVEEVSRHLEAMLRRLYLESQ